MSKLPTIAISKALPASEVSVLAERAAAYAEAAKAPNTRRAYQADLAIFSRWCAARGLAAMPANPTTLLAFLVDHAGKVRISTLQRRLAAIREAHRYNGTELDTSGAAFRDTWRGIRRAHARPPNKRAPMVTAVLRQALANACTTDKLISLRDRALLLIGFAGALRRGELASLEVAYRDGGRGWIETTPEGLAVHLCRSKTNQEGADETIAIPYGTALETCPVRSYAAWVESSGITSGPAFRPIDRHGNVGTAAISDQSVALIVKRAAYAAGRAAGMSDAQASAYAGRFSGHSLRRGLATSAAANDAPARSIQRQLRHRKADTTNGYIEEARLFRQNAAGFAGL